MIEKIGIFLQGFSLGLLLGFDFSGEKAHDLLQSCLPDNPMKHDAAVLAARGRTIWKRYSDGALTNAEQ